VALLRPLAKNVHGRTPLRTKTTIGIGVFTLITTEKTTARTADCIRGTATAHVKPKDGRRKRT
jgi:hypothetical protein